ncbi:MAG: putative protease SohB [Pseudomonadota bacterium]|jgi:signal peptide peptidase SppA
MRLMRHLIPFANLAPRVAVVRLSGPIGGGGRLGGGLSDASVGPVIERAFRAGRPTAVAIVINSPGGSAVQSALIAARIRRLAAERKLPVHAFVEDAAASGGYWLACAADDIWVDRSSILGSIGVISAGFGLADLIGRQGIERRVHTAGRSKSFADPFMPERPEDTARLRVVLDDIHEAFIDHVRTSRGARLKDAPGLFEGEFWTGQRAVDLGLADGIGHLEPKLRALYGDKVRLMRHGQRTPFLRRLGLARAAGEAVEGAVDAAQGRALWARLGL